MMLPAGAASLISEMTLSHHLTGHDRSLYLNQRKRMRSSSAVGLDATGAEHV